MKQYTITVGNKRKDSIIFSANSEQEAATLGAFLLSSFVKITNKK